MTKINFNTVQSKSKIFGLFIGYQQAFHNRVFIDATLGSGFHKADYSGKFSDKGRVIPSLIASGFIPKFDLRAGIAFWLKLLFYKWFSCQNNILFCQTQNIIAWFQIVYTNDFIGLQRFDVHQTS